MRAYFVALVLAAAATAAEIPRGAHVLLRMVNSINTRTAQEGDYVYLRTSTPISVDGNIVAPVDSYVQGVVAQSKRSGRVSGRAWLSIRLENLTLASGKVFKFSPQCKQGVIELFVVPLSRLSLLNDSEALKNSAPLTIRGHTFNALGKAEKSEHVPKLSSAWLRDMLNPLDESIVVGKYLLPIIWRALLQILRQGD